MNIEEAREACLFINKATESFPFGEDVLVFKVMNKMFAYMGLESRDGEHWLNLKCDPEKAIDLRERYNGIKPGYHSNKKYWNTIVLEGDVPDELVRELIQHSADEVINKLPQKKQEEYLDIIHLKETDSTNNVLVNLSHRDSLNEGCIVWADIQTAGKGQRGNGWESKKGQNLLFSILLYPTLKANEQFLLSQIVSLSIADCLKRYVEDISIKWPNDIYWKEKKICGILVENFLEGDSLKQSIVGIGLNINQEKFESDASNPISLRMITKEKYNPFPFLQEIRVNIFSYLSLLPKGKSETIRKKYLETLFRKDSYHLYSDEKGEFLARINNIEPTGLLVLETDSNEIRKYAFKEVKYIL